MPETRKCWRILAIATFTTLSAFSATEGTAAEASGEIRSRTGRRVAVDGVPVLQLWGDAAERGYAHGYLLADDILAMIADTTLSPRLMPEVAVYRNKVLPTTARMFVFAWRFEAELAGMLRGIRDARGEKGTRLPRVDRDLALADLKALNSAPDWIRMGCSSFSAWGSRTENGHTITARNLDYIDVPGMRTRHVVIVYLSPGGDRRPWVSVGYPGVIGACTAMNDEGVTLSMHDATGRSPTHAGQYVPRLLALRDAIERARARSFADDVRDALSSSPTLTGNNFHASAPFDGENPPAVVFEYDGDVHREHGVTLRLPGGEEDAAGPHDTLFCTNHFRSRAAARECDRYARLTARLDELASAGWRIDAGLACDAIKTVAVPTTMHTVVFVPHAREMHVSFADAERNAAAGRPVRLRLSDLLDRKSPAAAVADRPAAGRR